MEETLQVFGVVADEAPADAEFCILPDKGVVLVGSRIVARKAEIAEALSQLSAKALQASFWKTWDRAMTISEVEHLMAQMLHYVTVALRDHGWGTEIYLPDSCVPEGQSRRPIRIIRGLPAAEIVRWGLRLFETGVPMSEPQIQAVMNVIEYHGYRFTGAEQIANREAAVLVWDRLGILPNDPDQIVRYLVWKATGSTLVVKNPITIRTIRNSGVVLPSFDNEQLVALSRSFLRHKPLWLAFRHADSANRRVVNALRRLAKKHHVPMRAPVLLTLTADQTIDPQRLAAVAATAQTGTVLKALQAVRVYQEGGHRHFQIRNGKSYMSERQEGRPLAHYEAVLCDAIRARLAPHAVRLAKGVDLAFPVSGKQFVGAYPLGSTAFVGAKEGDLVVGIHWYNADDGRRVDMDLSVLDQHGRKIGWDATHRAGAVTFSGDVTNAPRPHGATEYLRFSGAGAESAESFLVCVNRFCGPPVPMTLIIGATNSQGQIAPDRIVIETLIESFPDCAQIVGIVTMAPHGVTMSLCQSSVGNVVTSRAGIAATNRIEALRVRTKAMLRIRDVCSVYDDDQDSASEPIDLRHPTHAVLATLL